MEVHHHPHSEKKSLKEYLLEGLMIFLAVSMGFIAENVREKFIENERAHELAESLYQEVYNDSIQLHKVINNREIKENELDYIIKYFRDSNIAKVSPHFYRSFTWSFLISSPITFEPADGMLNQLRNSGSLRYFKSSVLQNKLGELSVAIAKIRFRTDREGTYSHQFISPFVIRHYQFQWYNELTKNGLVPVVEAIVKEPDPLETPIIKNNTSFNKGEAENMASYYQLILRGTRQIQFNNYKEINHKILETLRKEYKLQ